MNQTFSKISSSSFYSVTGKIKLNGGEKRMNKKVTVVAIALIAAMMLSSVALAIAAPKCNETK
jgi:diacylglycerol kinase